ncbi:discoidin domain-containing protein [Lysinibacillus sphaericus]|uniref:discoidin domain-containing protein n=1 Tax=Lysinibacillus sphaericus TaxID=1421 RepID=UPI003F7A1BFA
MATIGQALPQPESGWKRYDNTNTLIEYKGAFTHENVTGAYNSTTSFNPKISTDGEIHFYFKGTSLRILSPNHPTIRTPKTSIFIDDVEFEIKCNLGNDYAVISFEKTGLEDKLHKVVIKNFTLNSGTTSIYAPFGLDAIDINDNGELRLPYMRLIVKNPTTNQHYSLADNTLIPLPDSSTKNMILHGIEQGKEIQLDLPFDKHRHFNENPVANVSGKVFMQDIGVINTLSIKEFKENQNFEPIYTWYNTNMTSNNSPSPLVASASSVYSGDYYPFRAFDDSLVGASNGADNTWITTNGVRTGWIQLDFGTPTKVNLFRLTPRQNGVTNVGIDSMPKNFNLLGSNNGVDYDIIKNYVNESWVHHTQNRQFVLDKVVDYRYYKIDVLENNGGSLYMAIGEISFGITREVN